MKLMASMMLSLDGVYQGPGGPDEDRRNGFDRGGWTAAFGDDEGWELLQTMFARADALLLGCKTWEIFEAYWPLHDDGDPVSHGINVLPKYVPSKKLKDPAWQNTHVITGDVEAAVRELKAKAGRRAPGPWQRQAAAVAARARPRRRAEPAGLPGHRG